MGRRHVKGIKIMETDFFKIIGEEENPSHLFIGGLHGKEGLSTINAIRTIENADLKKGSLVLCNMPASPYLSTLDPLYYLSLAGKKVIDLIREYTPEIYLELHCYHQDKKSKLTDSDRMEVSGVPGLVELEEGVLIGSTSPLIRSVFFKLYDFPFILEMPCNPPPESLEVCYKIMEIASKSSNRLEIMEKIGEVYPQQVERLMNYFDDFSHNFWPAFQEVKKKTQKIDLNGYDELDELTRRVVEEGGYDLNQAQIKQLSQVYVIFQEYG